MNPAAKKKSPDSPAAASPDTTAASRRRAPAAPPRFAAVELASAVREAPEGDHWFHEVKLDGYRILCRKEGRQVRLLSRNDKDWTERFRIVAENAALLPVRNALLDGEVVILDAKGRSSFQRLQQSVKSGRGKLVYFVFDLLHLDGRNLTGETLEKRKELLEKMLGSLGSPASSVIRYSRHTIGNGPPFFDAACRMGLEGIVSKKRNSPYRPGRGSDWLKVKCIAAQEFVVGGYTDPGGSRQHFGSLLLGVFDEGGRLRYVGNVGTGFGSKTLAALKARLVKLERTNTPFTNPPRVRTAHWVEPSLVAQVNFTEWTLDGRLRHPSFQGLREDKSALEVRLELPAAAVRKGR